MTIQKGQFSLIIEGLLFMELRFEAIYNPSLYAIIAPGIINAMLYLALGFLGLNVVDNWVKGKFYQPGLIFNQDEVKLTDEKKLP
jgi:hypothetical protein